jgi:uncharacterized protein
MQFKKIKENQRFIGRSFERERFKTIAQSKEASIIVVYGRRRVGKTELIEQSYRNRNLLKFEGIEGLPEKRQREHLLMQLSEIFKDPLIAKLQLKTWTEVLTLIAKYTAKGKWTLFFDEVQWLAAYKTAFISELKYCWDNDFRHNQRRIIVLCGSSPSFIINKVLHSKALYNRSQHEIPLQEFPLGDIKKFLKKKRSYREVMDAMLAVGGIPEYLKYLDKESSIFLGLCKNSFTQGGFFSNEYLRIFSSSLGNNPDFFKIIRFMSQRSFASRAEIGRHLGARSGGRLTGLLRELQLCGFITKYTPFQLKTDSLITRYHISDHYLQFYFKFIEPYQEEIRAGHFNRNPTRPLNTEAFDQWLGFAFERFCRKQHPLLAGLLGFGAVQYKSGSFFNRETERAKEGFQLDLVFDRKDKVRTICEIKYSRRPVTKKVITEFENKLALFPKKPQVTLEKVLIAAAGAEASVHQQGYFDRVLTLEDFFD